MSCSLARTPPSTSTTACSEVRSRSRLPTGAGAGKAHAVETVVEQEAEAVDAEDRRVQLGSERQGEEAVSDGSAEAARAAPLNIEMDPLTVTGYGGEHVNHVLIEQQRFADAELIADCVSDTGNAGEYTHGQSRSMSVPVPSPPPQHIAISA